MKVTYELTEADLLDVQLQLLVHHQQRLRESRLFLLFAICGAGAITYPLWLAWFGPHRPATFLLTVVLAGVIVRLLLPYLPVPRYRRLNAWRARKMNKRALAASVLGPVEVTLADDAVVRTNSRDELRVPWSELTWLHRSAAVLTLRIRKQHRVIVIPRRALQDEPAFTARLEALAKKKVLELSRQ
jgi:hypothetical protein